MNYKMDLHCHTSPESTDAKQTYLELIHTAKKHGIQYLSITNHDRVDHQELFKQEAQRQGIHYIKGVEVTATLTNTAILGYQVEVDVLIYNYAWNEETFKTFIKKYKKENDECFLQRKVLLEKKYGIDLSSAKADRNMAELLFQAGKFHLLRDAKHFIKYDVLMKPFAKKHVTLEETIVEAKKQGATIIMAHPFRKTLKNLGPFTVEEMHKLMPYYHQLGVDGLEPYHHENMDEDHYLFILEYSKKHNLLVSIGSDRHDIRESQPTHFFFDIKLDEMLLDKTINHLFHK